MKGKVQAQRKFAQGAIIQNQQEKRVENTPTTQIKQSSSNVIKNSLSATSLLDIVSLGRLHGHKFLVPLIVLERLPQDNGIKKTKPPNTKTGKHKIIKKRTRTQPPRRRRLRRIASGSETSDDDTRVPAPKRPISCSITEPSAKKRQTNDCCNDASSESTFVLCFSDDENPPKHPTPSQQPDLQLDPGPQPELKKNPEIKPQPELERQFELKPQPKLKPQLEVEQQPKLEPKDERPSSPEIELIPDPIPHPKSLDPKPVVKPENLLPSTSKNAYKSTSENFYGREQIVSWIDKEAITKTRKSLKSNITSPDNPQPPPPVPACISEQFNTLQDILAASKDANIDLNKRCKNCPHCARVDSVVQLQEIIEKQGLINTVNNFEFESVDAEVGAIAQYRSTKTSNKKSIESFYIDINTGITEVLQVSVDKSKGKKKGLTLHWVKRDSISCNKFQLSLHGIYLKDIVEILSQPQQYNNHKIAPQVTPRPKGKAAQVDAPVFRPTESEFTDPMEYFDKIMPIAAKYGICKVIAPESFKPSCHLNDEHKFNVSNQYLSRLYNRWGPGAREMCAIKAHLASQGVVFKRPPLIEGMEVNLPKLNHVVQRNGGLKSVIQKKKWGKVAEEMRLNYGPNPNKKLDNVYVKYILPYGTLSAQERQQLTGEVEKQWFKKNQKLLDRALKPLHRQRKLLGESESSDDETEEDEYYSKALVEAEDCIAIGRMMNLTTFKKVASTMMKAHFPDGTPTSEKVEQEFWRLVLLAIDHVCVYAASIDTGDEGHGFTKNKNDPYGKHPWNLKVMSGNNLNLLRALGPVLGLTVPTLHLGMIFSTSCWHRDPQGLPWVEYLHEGSSKIWYGIPMSESKNFRRAVETLCPTACQNKSIWLPSDITMIPPDILCENMVSLSRLEQKPGEFVIVCPKGYSCSISTGYCVSESIYFGTMSWLSNVHQIFEELRESCEPTTFALEQLMIALVRDSKTPQSVLHLVYSNLQEFVTEELSNRRTLRESGIKVEQKSSNARKQSGAWNARDIEECEICRTTLYLSSVTGLISKKSAFCLRHALRMLDLPQYSSIDKQRLTLSLCIPDETLSQIMKLNEQKLEQSSSKRQMDK